jgi:ABC-type lipoprotein release transport system permease subunit
LAGGLAASGESSSGVSLRGLDMSREGAVSSLGEAISSGEWLDAEDSHGVVVGRRLAKNLGVQVGSEIVVVSQGTDGSVANDLYIVRGILKSVGEITDRSALFLNAETFRELMVLPTGAHRIVLRRGDQPLEAVADQIRSMAPDLDVQTWKQRLPVVAQMIDMGKIGIYIMSFIIYLAVGLLILNAMLTAVFERIREFGVLKAIGAGPMKVMSLILVEGAVQAAVASVLGLVLAAPGMWYLTVHGLNMGALGGMDAGGVAVAEIWYGEFSVQSCAGPLIILWMMTLLAVVYPAIKAAWINPITAMRHR